MRGSTSIGSGRKSVTVFRATAAGIAALAKYGAPEKPSLRNDAPSPRRQRKAADALTAKQRATRAITNAMIARLIADPDTPEATRARMQAISAKRAASDRLAR